MLPDSDAGRLLAIADKLDSLVGLFAVGLAPKSTSDPYGLRRSALGILQILLDQSISVDLRRLIALAGEGQPLAVDQSVKRQTFDFMTGRFETLLNEEWDYPPDVVRAVLSEQAHDPARARQGGGELAQWVARDDWEAILDAFARCVRITRAEDARELAPERLCERHEKLLYERYLQSSARLSDSANVDGFLSAIASMVPAITAFFDHVLVHTDDVEIRNNRIALLQRIAAMQKGRTDLSELENF